MKNSAPACTVILSTYNSPRTLELALTGWAAQDVAPSEIIVADDGSTAATAAVVEAWATRLPLVHLWQQDRGFRKSRILNLAIEKARHPYLLFTDGDCLPRPDLLRQHLRFARPGCFVSGTSYIDIPRAVHADFAPEDVAAGRVFDYAWLAARLERDTERRHLARARFVTPGAVTIALDVLTANKKAFVGNNASGWRDDLLRVNGFDEAFGHVEDRELGYRLSSAGARGLCHKYSLCVLHLGHDHPYVDAAEESERKRMAAERLRNHVIWTESGISFSVAAHSAEEA